MGLKQAKDNSLLWLSAVSVIVSKREPILYRKAAAITAELWNYAESIDANSSWVYINNADPS